MTRHASSPDHDNDSLHHDGGNAVAPGKRTRTQSIPTLRGRERDVALFDAAGEYREDRATVDGPPTTSRLSDRQLRKARQRNPYWQDRLGFSTATFGGGDIASGELADDVADRQGQLGLAVDGIAGPKTVAAMTSGSAPGGEPDAGDDRSADASVDDPFGMHLVRR